MTSKENQQLIKKHRSTFLPLQRFGYNVGSHFKGTLFRFPLRSAEKASSSEISASSHSAEEIISLLLALEKEAPRLMLFLRHVQAIETIVWTPDNEEHSIFTCSIRMDNAKINKCRTLMNTIPYPLPKIPSKVEPIHCTFKLEVQLELMKSELTKRMYYSKSTLCYLISQGVGSRRALDLAHQLAALKHDIRPVPFAGVAFLLETQHEDTKHGQQGNFSLQPTLTIGNPYVFLPLPVSTGLPFHINGYFEISENRRDIWYGNDLTGSAKLRSGKL